MLFALNEYSCATYDGETIRVCGPKAKDGVVGEYRIEGVRQLCVSRWSRWNDEMFVAAFLRDGRIVVGMLQQDRFIQPFGQARVERIPTSMEVYICPSGCILLVGYNHTDVCMYSWDSMSEKLVAHPRTLVIGDLVGISKTGVVVTVNRQSNQIVCFCDLLIGQGWTHTSLTRNIRLHIDTKSSVPITSVDVLDYPHVSIVQGKKISGFSNWNRTYKTYPSRIFGCRRGTIFADVGSGTKIVADVRFPRPDHDLSFMYCTWAYPNEDVAIPYKGIFSVDARFRRRRLEYHRWTPGLHRWTTAAARAWVPALLYACSLASDVVLGCVIPLVVKNPAKDYVESESEDEDDGDGAPELGWDTEYY